MAAASSATAGASTPTRVPPATPRRGTRHSTKMREFTQLALFGSPSSSAAAAAASPSASASSMQCSTPQRSPEKPQQGSGGGSIAWQSLLKVKKSPPAAIATATAAAVAVAASLTLVSAGAPKMDFSTPPQTTPPQSPRPSQQSKTPQKKHEKNASAGPSNTGPLKPLSVVRVNGFQQSPDALTTLFHSANEGCILKGGKMVLTLDEVQVQGEPARFTVTHQGGALIKLGAVCGSGMHKMVCSIAANQEQLIPQVANDKCVVKFYKMEILQEVEPALLRKQLMSKLALSQYQLMHAHMSQEPLIRLATLYNEGTTLKDGYSVWEFIEGVNLETVFTQLAAAIKKREDIDASPQKAVFYAIQRFVELAVEFDTPLDLKLDNFIIDKAGKLVLIDMMEKPDSFRQDVVTHCNDGVNNNEGDDPLLQILKGLEACSKDKTILFKFYIENIAKWAGQGNNAYVAAFQIFSDHNLYKGITAQFEVMPDWLRLAMQTES